MYLKTLTITGESSVIEELRFLINGSTGNPRITRVRRKMFKNWHVSSDINTKIALTLNNDSTFGYILRRSSRNAGIRLYGGYLYVTPLNPDMPIVLLEG